MRFKKSILIFMVMLNTAGSAFLPGFCAKAYATPNKPEHMNAQRTDAAISQPSSPVAMDVAYVYEGDVKRGHHVPICIDLTNQEQTEFEGIIRIQTIETDFDHYDYNYPVSLSGGENIKKNVYIPAGRGEFLHVELLDGNGAELVQKSLKANVSQDVAELFVGALSDFPDSLNYLNGVGVNYSSLRIKVFNLTADSMPDKAAGLELLDVLLVTDYDTRKLSDSQIGAIWEWVKEGGTLLIGTGGRADDAIAAFRDEILETSYSSPAMRSVDMGVEYAANGPGDSSIDLMCADISLKGGDEVLFNDEFPVLTSISKGKGLVGVAAYDFVDIAAFCETQRSYMDKLFTSLLGEEKLNRLSSDFYNGNSSKYWAVQSILNTGNADRLPNFPLYVIVILGYIVLAGPGLYLLLKKQKRRRFFRLGVIALSLAFSAAIYLMGAGTRFKSTFLTYARIMDTSEKSVDEYAYINVQTPYNKPYAISIDPSYDLQPITKYVGYNQTSTPKPEETEGREVRVEYNQDETRISAQNITAFTPAYYYLAQKSPNTNNIGLTGNVTLFNGQVSGTVTNRYSFPVEKVGMLMYGQMVVINELGAGETASLDGLDVIDYPLNSFYPVAKRVTGGYLYEKADIGDSDYLLALSRTNILSFYLDAAYASAYSPEACIVAFGGEQPDSLFSKQEEYDASGVTMFTAALDINTEKDGYSCRSALVRTPRVLSGQYYAPGNYAYGMNPVVLEYSLGNDIDVESLAFEVISNEFLDYEKTNGLMMFDGSMYFYNHDTGIYDLMDSRKSVYTVDELKPYLSPGNTMTTKYVFDLNSDYSGVVLPVPNALGRVK